MYTYFVRQFVKKSFESLNHGDYESVLQGVSPSITHTFSGTHALSGTRHSVEAMRQWFQRLYILSPKLEFEIKNIVVSGFPWDTTIAVEWVDTAMPQMVQSMLMREFISLRCGGAKLYTSMLTWIHN